MCVGVFLSTPSNFWQPHRITCAATEEPATAVERYAAEAVGRGALPPREILDAAMDWFCYRRSCGRALVDLRLEVPETGVVEVPIYGDPAGAVLEFCRQAAAAGMAVTEELAASMLAWFCERRSCRTRALPPSLTALVEPHGPLNLPPWTDPADGVEAFGAEHKLEAVVMERLMQGFCSRRTCGRLGLRAPWLDASPVPPDPTPI